MIALPPRRNRTRDAKGKPLESPIRDAIRAALSALPGVVLWRNNTGMLRDRNGTPLRFGLAQGSADLVGIVQVTVYRPVQGPRMGVDDWKAATLGRFFACEVKRPGERPSIDQYAWLDVVNAAGGYGCWADSVESAIDHVNEARRV